MCIARVTTDSNKDAIIDTNGEYIIPPGEYTICDIEKPLIRLKKSGVEAYRFANHEGYIFNTGYSKANDFQEGLAAVANDNLYGFIDTHRDFVIPPRFEEVTSLGFQNGLCLVKEKGKYGFINTSGQYMVENKYSWCRNFKCGLTVACITTPYLLLWETHAYFLINSKGELLLELPKEYDFYKIINEHLISYSSPGLSNHGEVNYGLMNTQGEILTPPIFYTNLDDYCLEPGELINDTLKVVDNDREPWYFTAYGQPTDPVPDKVNTHRLSKVEIPPYDEAIEMPDGWKAVRVGDRWGFLNKENVLTTEIKFSRGEVWKGKKDEIFISSWDGGLAFHCGLMKVTQKVKGEIYKGFINEKGEVQIPIRFRHASDRFIDPKDYV